MTPRTTFRVGMRTCAVLLVIAAATFGAAHVDRSAVVMRGQETASPPTVASDSGDPAAQPIDFSHARHAGEARIDCQFCHAYARRGPVAGIPSVQRCVGCHQTILPEAPEVRRVLDYWEKRQPIPWVRVHNLPDYVRFSHRPHLRAGFDCAECHGDVRQMTIAEQVSSLSMGWCVECHETNNASRDCLICHY